MKHQTEPEPLFQKAEPRGATKGRRRAAHTAYHEALPDSHYGAALPVSHGIPADATHVQLLLEVIALHQCPFLKGCEIPEITENRGEWNNELL